MKVELKLSLQQYLNIVFLLAYRKPLMILINLSSLLMFIVSLYYALNKSALISVNVYIMLLIGSMVLVLLPVIIYISVRKNYKSNSFMSELISYEFTDETIVISGISVSYTKNWNEIFKVEELKNWILIYPTPQVVNTIAKEAFGDNLIEFKNLIKSKGIKTNFRK